MLVKRSVTGTLAATLITIVILSVLSTGIALLTVVSSLSDAAAVNIAGSLRMQSYRLAYELTNNAKLVDRHLEDYALSLKAPALQALDRFYVPEDVKSRYTRLRNTWEQLDKQLRQKDTENYLRGVANYVAQVDQFVLALQHYSERKMVMVVVISLAGVLAIVALALFAIHFTRKQVVAPLSKLVSASEMMQQGYFSHQPLDVELLNEMGVLSRAFSRMSDELEKLYRSLEDKVREKTERLTLANRSLGVMFDCSQAMTVSQITRDCFERVLNIVRTSESLTFLQLEIHDNGNGRWLLNCGENDGQQATQGIPLVLDTQVLGELRWPAGQAAQLQLMQNVANMLSRGVYFNRAQKQHLQLLLMEERATIARELHDSLAQALSFLRIQLTLLKRATDSQNQQAQDVIRDFDQALNNAYRQLRELLATFRLTIQEVDLKEALHQLLSPLKLQTDAMITLNCTLSSQSLNAQQQVHVLQIVREAVVNAIKHANAKHIVVECHRGEQEENIISVTDDGVGIANLTEPDGHYGLNIMTERAQCLGGNLTISAQKKLGTEVKLTFR